MGRLRWTAPCAVLAAAVVALAGCGGGSGHRDDTPAEAAKAFLDRYVEPDGRVVRRDQGGDTVSEGQAYALQLAVVAGDRARFSRVWAWTRTHLRRPDGLLSWHWEAGRVADPQPSADADLDAAYALLIGARRFRVPALAGVARAMAAQIRRAETTAAGVLVAGPWARDGGVVDPSYFDPRELAALGLGHVAEATRGVVAALLREDPAPSDWAVAGPPPRRTGPPGQDGAPPSYGFDAARLPIRLAASCDPRDRALAARLQTPSPSSHPVFTVARAARAHAAGDHDRAASLLSDAADQDAGNPTYYGAAWVALGRALLEGGLPSPCPPHA